MNAEREMQPRTCLTRRRGFALLLTVVLLSFLAVVLLALACVVRIDTRLSAGALAQEAARRNALFALRMAAGRLQEAAGRDARVTATAGFMEDAAQPFWTGVWDTADMEAAPVWLVSGAAPDPLAGPPAGAARMRLVGGTGAAGAGCVDVETVEISVEGVPGFEGSRAIGRIGWWVGDQGVKAAVARAEPRGVMADPVLGGSAELRQRIDQHAGIAANPSEFDPLAPALREHVGGIIDGSQLAFLEGMDAEKLRARFHDWSVDNLAVIASTLPPPEARRGLKTDLSLLPDAAGSGIAAWLDWGRWMEDPAAPDSPAPVPAFAGMEDPRRRHRMVPPAGGEIEGTPVFSVAPVLTMFMIQFNVRTAGGSATAADLEVRARMLCSLWNPWTSALVPEELDLEVEGLPALTVADSNGGSARIGLQELYGGPMRIRLTFTEENPSFAGDPDDRSWLPGRVYCWRSGGRGEEGWRAEFYSRTLAVANDRVWVVPAGASIAGVPSGAVTLSVDGPAAQLTVRLRRARDGALLATFEGPEFSAFSVAPRRLDSSNEYRFGFPFRLMEGFHTPAGPDRWLATDGLDPREAVLGAGAFTPFAAGPDPSQYVGSGGNAAVSAPDLLLDRIMGVSGMSHNEDAPVFELPRLPPVSLGSLQHLRIAGRRPFSIGNPWERDGINALFDTCFLSGLGAGATAGGGAGPWRPPNPFLVPAAAVTGGSPATLDGVLRDGGGGLSGRHLLVSGAFNLNSTSAAAWRAILGRVRFPQGDWRHVNRTASSRGGADQAAPVLQAALCDAVFPRFGHSAQETWSAEPGRADPSGCSAADTHLFNRGLRVLASSQLDALASGIAARVARRQGRAGPFPGIAAFLEASPLFSGRSLMEDAIADPDGDGDPSDGLNRTGAGTGLVLAADVVAGTMPDGEEISISSQRLTQADIMTVLAPVLAARSDTFLVRACGEALNPALDEGDPDCVAGRAWCEAVIQRTPEPLRPSDAAAGFTDEDHRHADAGGRRFRIISFRWLGPGDL